MSKESRLANNRILIENFLVDRKIPEMFKVPYDPKNPYAAPFGYIYCIENIKNGKKYVGSVYATWTGIQNPSPTMQIRKRASNYLYEYNIALETIKNSATKQFRPIIQAMVDDGIENFIMYPLGETNKDNHIAGENYFINKLNTIANGYNVVRASSSFRITENNPIGKKLSVKDKQIRSEGVLCINMNEKKLIFSESMKLFGDYMNTSKDMIKNANRGGRAYKGWFVFYVDPDKRSYILDKNVLGDGIKDPKRRHSDKSKSFYKTLYSAASLFIQNNANREFFPEFELLPTLEYKE